MIHSDFNTINQCRACRGLKLKEFLYFKALPVSGIYLKRGCFNKEFSLPLSLMYCERCGLVQTKETITPEIYTQYNYTGTFSQRYIDYLDWLSGYFINRKGIKKKNVLEIGCSGGYLLKRFRDLGGNDVFGYEPSRKLANKCREVNIPVAEDYFSEKTRCLSGFNSDLIIIRHVLEHLDNLNSFLGSVYRSLKEDGMVLVEVPDVQKTLSNKIYSNIFHEHLNYFSFYSLSNLFKKHKLFPVFLKEVDIHSGSILLVFIKDKSKEIHLSFSKVTLEECKKFAGGVINYYKEIKDLVKRVTSEGHKVYGYGAAERTFSILGGTGFSSKDIQKIYDKNVFLYGKYMPISHILIDSPKHIKRDNVKYLIIFAISFEEEIIKELKSKYGFKGVVISIKNKPKFIKI